MAESMGNGETRTLYVCADGIEGLLETGLARSVGNGCFVLTSKGRKTLEDVISDHKTGQLRPEAATVGG